MSFLGIFKLLGKNGDLHTCTSSTQEPTSFTAHPEHFLTSGRVQLELPEQGKGCAHRRASPLTPGQHQAQPPPCSAADALPGRRRTGGGAAPCPHARCAVMSQGRGVVWHAGRRSPGRQRALSGPSSGRARRWCCIWFAGCYCRCGVRRWALRWLMLSDRLWSNPWFPTSAAAWETVSAASAPDRSQARSYCPK